MKQFYIFMVILFLILPLTEKKASAQWQPDIKNTTKRVLPEVEKPGTFIKEIWPLK